MRCAKGLRVVADHSYDDVPPLDVLLYPGGRAPGRSCTTRTSWPGCASSARPCRY
ncbi:hypothetical protein [Saccharomonospora glauca]|uniref:hypothetical protein n=1 Tax=Saccharomonospora glauca TaxID=40990 RepID=UPI0022B6CB20|nr:hypothetical protein [Saccharomonospora glauca]